MKKIAFILPFAIAALMASQSAFSNQKLATEKNCMACHAVDKKLLGPSYKDVAAKYAGQKDALATLTTKVMKGGGGVWGGYMPANPQVTPEEAKTLVAWILSQK
jgi:cytochrome c